MADPKFSLGYSGMDEVGRALALLYLETGHPVKKPEWKGGTRGMIAAGMVLGKLWGPDGAMAKALGKKVGR